MALIPSLEATGLHLQRTDFLFEDIEAHPHRRMGREGNHAHPLAMGSGNISPVGFPSILQLWDEEVDLDRYERRPGTNSRPSIQHPHGFLESDDRTIDNLIEDLFRDESLDDELMDFVLDDEEFERLVAEGLPAPVLSPLVESPPMSDRTQPKQGLCTDESLMGWEPLQLEDVIVNKELAKHLTCCICFDFLEDPTVLSCGHTLCHDCMSSWKSETQHSRHGFTCPLDRKRVRWTEKNHLVHELVQSMEVRCDFSCNTVGWPERATNQCCSEVMPREKRMAHMRECPFAYVICPNRKCGKKLLRFQVQEHLGECIQGGMRLTPTIFAQLTPCLNVTCPNKGCNYCKPDSLTTHSEHCVFAIIDCSASDLGCTQKFKRHERAEHDAVCPYVKLRQMQHDQERANEEIELLKRENSEIVREKKNLSTLLSQFAKRKKAEQHKQHFFKRGPDVSRSLETLMNKVGVPADLSLKKKSRSPRNDPAAIAKTRPVRPSSETALSVAENLLGALDNEIDRLSVEYRALDESLRRDEEAVKNEEESIQEETEKSLQRFVGSSMPVNDMVLELFE